MENLTCKGLSAAHRRMLIKCITEEIGSIPEPVEIEFMEPIRRKQYSSLMVRRPDRCHSGSRLRF